jgi:uncharacterized damage-inducible protein DinB
MAIVDALLPEFDHEVATTRTLLERIPEDKLAWRPHPKSMSLGGLATHLANLASWGQVTLDESSIDLATAGVVKEAVSRAEVLAVFDRNAAATRASLAGKTDAELMAPWALKRHGSTLFTMPKASVWRSFVMNHLIHHRGQLTVYLRLQDVPLPSIYGPSADEAGF